MKFFILILLIFNFSFSHTEEELNNCFNLNSYFQYSLTNPLVLVNSTANKLFIENFLQDLSLCPAPAEDIIRYTGRFLKIINGTNSLSHPEYMIQVSETSLQKLPQPELNFQNLETLSFLETPTFLKENNLFIRVDPQLSSRSSLKVTHQKSQVQLFNKNFMIDRSTYRIPVSSIVFCQNLPEIHELIKIEKWIQSVIQNNMIQKVEFHPYLTTDSSSSFNENIKLQIHSQVDPEYLDNIINNAPPIFNDFMKEFLIPLRDWVYVRDAYTQKIREYCTSPSFLSSGNLYINEDFFQLEEPVVEPSELISQIKEKFHIEDVLDMSISYYPKLNLFKRRALMLSD